MTGLYTSPTQGPTDRLAEIIQRALEERVREIVSIQATIAAGEVERKVREETAQIAARVVNRMSFERHGNELTIHVAFGDGKNS